MKLSEIFNRNGLSNTVEFKFSISVFVSTYFIYKFIMYFCTLMNFSLINNLILFALCTAKFKKPFVSAIYRTLIFVLSVAIFYMDTHFSELPSNQLPLFSLEYLSSVYDYTQSFFTLNNIAYFIGILGLIFFTKDIFHYQTVITALFICVAVMIFNENIIANDLIKSEQKVSVVKSSDILEQTGEKTSENIENYLTTFLKQEKDRIVQMPAAIQKDFVPFNIVLVNICSMATDDIVIAKQTNHSVFSKFDIKFNNFSSVASYSTPGSMRLLRANCGQENEATMYSQRRPECELLTTLDKIGFSSEVYMDHDGVYGDYHKTLHDIAGLPENKYPLNKLSPKYTAYDGSVIYSDRDLFNAYILNLDLRKTTNNISFMNILSLHDGNKKLGQRVSLSYETRIKTLLDDIKFLLDELDKRDLKSVVVMIPEHGAALRGDKMQISKLREIPTDTITKIPVMIRFAGTGKKPINMDVNGSFSYLAVSSLIKEIIDNNIYGSQDIKSTIKQIVSTLPQTAHINESTNAYFMNFQSDDFYKLKGELWNPYIK